MIKRPILLRITVADAMVRILLLTRKNQAVAIHVTKFGRLMLQSRGLSGGVKMSSNVSANTMQKDWMRNGEKGAG